MPSTHFSLNYHLIFGTKNRLPLIHEAWRQHLHAYLGGVLREMQAIAQAVGGVADHVHILAGLKATHSLPSVLRDLKRASSEWVHREIRLPGFAWQEGYGAFTVSASECGKVCNYIATQEQHHRKQDFRQEYVLFLERHGVVYNEKYID